MFENPSSSGLWSQCAKSPMGYRKSFHQFEVSWSDRGHLEFFLRIQALNTYVWILGGPSADFFRAAVVLLRSVFAVLGFDGYPY